eukprot:Opistho-2@59459
MTVRSITLPIINSVSCPQSAALPVTTRVPPNFVTGRRHLEKLQCNNATWLDTYVQTMFSPSTAGPATGSTGVSAATVPSSAAATFPRVSANQRGNVTTEGGFCPLRGLPLPPIPGGHYVSVGVGPDMYGRGKDLSVSGRSLATAPERQSRKRARSLSTRT